MGVNMINPTKNKKVEKPNNRPSFPFCSKKNLLTIFIPPNCKNG